MQIVGFLWMLLKLLNTWSLTGQFSQDKTKQLMDVWSLDCRHGLGVRAEVCSCSHCIYMKFRWFANLKVGGNLEGREDEQMNLNWKSSKAAASTCFFWGIWFLLQSFKERFCIFSRFFIISSLVVTFPSVKFMAHFSEPQRTPNRQFLARCLGIFHSSPCLKQTCFQNSLQYFIGSEDDF